MLQASGLSQLETNDLLDTDVHEQVERKRLDPQVRSPTYIGCQPTWPPSTGSSSGCALVDSCKLEVRRLEYLAWQLLKCDSQG